MPMEWCLLLMQWSRDKNLLLLILKKKINIERSKTIQTTDSSTCDISQEIEGKKNLDSYSQFSAMF